MLIRIVAPHFVAGLVLDSAGRVVEAAPILKWTMGKRFADDLIPYFKRRGWSFQTVLAHQSL